MLADRPGHRISDLTGLHILEDNKTGKTNVHGKNQKQAEFNDIKKRSEALQSFCVAVKNIRPFENQQITYEMQDNVKNQKQSGYGGNLFLANRTDKIF